MTKPKQTAQPMMVNVQVYRDLLAHHRKHHERQGWDVGAMIEQQNDLLEQGITRVPANHPSQLVIMQVDDTPDDAA